MTAPDPYLEAPPREGLARLFLRFLRFGLLAWGGPVAQIAMIRQELVEEEGWIGSERFNRVLAIYQVLPGPEAAELCVYFGFLARGRLGGFLAGLGFMLPGFLLMLALSAFYFAFRLRTSALAPVFYAIQPTVIALILRAVHRIGGHALHDPWLLGIAAIAGVGQLLGMPFAVTLLAAGLAYTAAQRGSKLPALALGIFYLIAAMLWINIPHTDAQIAASTSAPSASLPTLFFSGLRSGLLTFGGAYTVIPYLQHDAVVQGGWMTNAQFLDGLALSSILPAPLIIFSTFVGYAGGELPGALVLSLGIWIPAFAFTLIGHETVEHLIENHALHRFLDGVTAGVVGLIAATSLQLGMSTLTGWREWLIFAAALTALYLWKTKWAIAVIILTAGFLGLVLYD